MSDLSTMTTRELRRMRAQLEMVREAPSLLALVCAELIRRTG